MAKRKKAKTTKSSSGGGNVFSDSIIAFLGLGTTLIIKNIVSETYPPAQASFYPYAVEAGTGLLMALLSKKMTGKVSDALIIGNLSALGLTGVSSLTANNSNRVVSTLFQTQPQFLAY
ncbi:MAG: hypothetical protein ACYC97_02105 [Metallibacterium sp.]